jgi:hypothetical protein
VPGGARGVLQGLGTGEGGYEGLDLLAHLGELGGGAGRCGDWGLLLRDVVGAVVYCGVGHFEEFSVFVQFF